MKNKISEKIYRVVMYLRLSDEDGDNRESDSISNQRILNKGFLEGKPEFEITKECVDDGYTGTNFSRPGFQEMMKMLENGEADCIICKDLSRFGRDFSGVLKYVERILPQMGVRLILVNDQYDSMAQNHDFITLRLKSFINDIYPADTSRSVRANLRAKMVDGQCVAPFVFYGFLKSPENKHRLILDPVASSVVKDIFHLKLKGHSLLEIAHNLNLRGIMTPLVYKNTYLKQNFKTGFLVSGNNQWEATMVRRILSDERYTGVLIQGKTTTPNHKVKKIIRRGEDEWVRYENAFEGAIDKHTYDVVQNLLGRDTRKSANGLSFLGGLVECADCHQSMIRKSPNRSNYYYVCSSSLYEKTCSSHSISEAKLIDTVKKSIIHYISLIVELDEILRYVKKTSISQRKLYEEDLQLKVLEQESERILKIKMNLYNSFSEGLLDEEEFKSYKKKYDAALEQTEEAIKKQKIEIEDVYTTLEKQQEWMKHFLIYKDCDEIDRIMLVMLVKRIFVDAKKRVTIQFWFSDEFERLISILSTVNRVQPIAELEGFLLREGES